MTGKSGKKPGKTGTGEARAMSDLLGQVMEPVMQRRSGMTVALLKAWGEIAGDEFRDTTKPERIDWPRRAHEEDPFEPATLVVACDNSSAVFFQHEQAVILDRVNLFFGFEAVRRIRIVQKPVHQVKPAKEKQARSLSGTEEAELASRVSDIDNQTLKQTMMKLGRAVLAQSR